MGRTVIGALGALLLVAAGVFWWQGHAAIDSPAPVALPMLAESTSAEDQDSLPEADPGDLQGPDLPHASEQTREQRRFDRLDRDRDGRVTRNEILAPRVKDFRKLDIDGNNLLTFEEWAASTANKFKAADANGDLWLSRPEFATTRQKKAARPACKCK